MAEYNETSPEIVHLCAADSVLAQGIRKVGPLSYTPYNDGFSFIVQTIISQMLSSKVADVLINRMLGLCDQSLTPETVLPLETERLRSIGLSNQKAANIHGFARYCADHPLFVEELALSGDEEICKRLTLHKGIGMWTAKMYLIFVLDRLDVLPYEDGAFLQAFHRLYPDKEMTIASVKRQGGLWAPYESLAARHLYCMLDKGLTKTPLVKGQGNL